MAKFVFYDANINKLLAKDEDGVGGASIQSYNWIRGLLALGHEVSVSTYGDGEQLNSTELEINYVPFYDNNKGIRWIRWIYYRFPSIYKNLKKVSPDYFYESIPSWGSLLIGLICNRLKIKYIIRLSNDNTLDAKNRKTDYWILKLGINRCDYLLCQNDYQFNQAERAFPGKKILKITNPFVLRKEGKIAGPKTYIAWVANFRYVKNLRLLYEIAELMDNQQFKIAGVYSNKEDAETTLYLEKLSSLRNVDFVGYIKREKIFEFLSKAKFLLNTSRYEGFSNTFIEAMSVGTPVLSTNNANPDEILYKNRLGIIYTNSNDLKLQLENLPKTEYLQMSEDAIQYVKGNHDHIQLSKQLVDFLEG